MTDMLVRPLADNRMLRAAGGADLTVSLGQSLESVFDTPMMTGLVGQSWAEATAGLDAFTEQQRLDLRQSEFDRQQEVSNLESELDWSTDDRRDEITLRLGELSKERDVQLQAETQRSLDEGRLQEPESLNELYGELDLKFDRPMAAGEAKMLADNKRAEMIRQSIISKGPTGLLPGVAKFGAGLAAMAVDPLEVASMFIPVVGLGGRIAATARFGKVGGRVIVGATEGFVGSALTEPIYYGLSRQQQLDYTMSDALLNVGLGTVFGGGIGAIGGVLARADAPVAARVDGEPVRVDMPDAVRAVPEITPTRLDIDPIAARVARVEADTSLRQFTNDQSVDVEPARVAVQPEKSVAAVEPTKVTKPNVQIEDAVLTKYPDMKLSVTGNVERGFTINRIEVPKDVRETGIGTKAMNDIVQMADEMGAQVNLTPDNTFGGTKGRLVKFYKRFGFVENKGANKDFTTMETMYRDPDPAKIVKELDTPAVKQESASRLADHAEDIESDPLVNMEASARYDEPIPETFIDDDIEVGDAVIKQMEDAGDLTAEQKTMIAEVKQMEAHAKAYADVTEAAAICMGRT